MIPRHITLHKKRGETPLQAITTWKDTDPEFASISASYAGRLDPMAEGKLLVLLGDECKRQNAYHGLDKEYEIEVVFDIATDSADVLGLATSADTETHPSHKEVVRALKKLSGAHSIPYPAFSSKTVNGKPLFLYKLEGTLDTIVIPEHIETVYSVKLLNIESVSKDTLQRRIESNLAVVPRASEEAMAIGRDFRQDEIRAKWKEFFTEIPDRAFSVLSLRITCASGTYMRTFAERLAKELGTQALALSINRTEIGKYKQIGSLGFWTKKY